MMINDKVYFECNSGNVNYQCTYNDSFDLYHDIYFYIQNDCNDGMAESDCSFDPQQGTQIFSLHILRLI